MDFAISAVQRAWQQKAGTLCRELPEQPSAAGTIAGAARLGLIDPAIDLLSAALAVEMIARESAAVAIAFAMHTSVVLSVAGHEIAGVLARGERCGCLAMSAEETPLEDSGRLTGRATWVGPLTNQGVAIVGARRPGGEELVACAASLDAPGVVATEVTTAGLAGFPCGHLEFTRLPAIVLGSPVPVMARVRVLLAAAGLGMGRRALGEALNAAHAYGRTGPGGEQTLQGLVADAATEIDAATLLTWRAAASPALSLGAASMAKLAAAEAAQRAVARTSQVVGAEAFRRGHVVERLAQDVRALEVFAGRTEALREAVAGETLPG